MAEGIIQITNTEQIKASGETIKREVEELVRLAEELNSQKEKINLWQPVQPKQIEVKNQALEAIDTLNKKLAEANESARSFGEVSIQTAQNYEAVDEAVAKAANSMFSA